MRLITVAYVPRGWLWVAPTWPTFGYISPGELACKIITLDTRVHSIMDCIACMDETTSGPVSPPPRY